MPPEMNISPGSNDPGFRDQVIRKELLPEATSFLPPGFSLIVIPGFKPGRSQVLAYGHEPQWRIITPVNQGQERMIQVEYRFLKIIHKEECCTEVLVDPGYLQGIHSIMSPLS